MVEYTNYEIAQLAIYFFTCFALAFILFIGAAFIIYKLGKTKNK